MELIGKANLQAVGPFQELARSQAPFLGRHYPASSVLQACPPPQTTRPAPHGVSVESHDLSSLGLPVLRADSSFTHAIATTPAGPVELCRSGLDQRRPSPSVGQVGSRIARFEDCSAFTHVMACVLADSLRSLFQECFSPSRCLLEPLQVLPAGATSCRAGFAPAGINMPFHGTPTEARSADGELN